MSVNFELNATTRESGGTTASRKSRRDGQVPAMVYGAGKQNQQLLLDSNEISTNRLKGFLGIHFSNTIISSLK